MIKCYLTPKIGLPLTSAIINPICGLKEIDIKAIAGVRQEKLTYIDYFLLIRIDYRE